MPDMREIEAIREATVNHDSQSVWGVAESLAVTCEDSFLLFANFAMPVTAAKAAAAMFRGQGAAKLSCRGYGYARKCEEGYRVIVNRLPQYSTCQVIIVSNRPTLLLGDRNDAIWRYLNSPAITTPLLPEWIDYIVRELDEKALVRAPNGFGYPVHVAHFGTVDVDAIVTNGLKRKKIRV